MLVPDSGALYLDGQHYARISSPRRAATLGVATVFQEILVFTNLTVLDNIWLGCDGLFRRRLTPAQKEQGAREVLERISQLGHKLDVRVQRARHRRAATLRPRAGLVRQPKLLILDEATSSLDEAARERLFEELRRRCQLGMSVLFTTHRMDEIAELAESITVLRSGHSVATLRKGEADTAELVRLMSGRERGAPSQFARSGTSRRSSAPVMRLSEVRLRPEGQPINLAIEKGEVTCVAGLDGQGQQEFLETLVGLRKPATGTVRVGAEQTPVTSLRTAAQHGIVYVPRDRTCEGVFEQLSILENFAMPRLKGYSRLVGLSRKRMSADFSVGREQLQIRYGTRNRSHYEPQWGKPAKGFGGTMALVPSLDHGPQRPHAGRRPRHEVRPL